MIWYDVDNLSHKNRNPVVTELFIKSRKRNISLVFITQSSFKAQKDVRLNIAYFFNMKISNKTEIQRIGYNHSSCIDFKNFLNLYRKCTAKPYLFSY